MKQLTFDIDEFKQPRTYSGSKGEALLLYHSLAGRRNSTHVTDELAFEIRRFRFDDFKDISNRLQNELNSHCSKYLPNIYIKNLLVTEQNADVSLLTLSVMDKIKNSEGVIVYSVERTPTEVLVNLMSAN